MTENRNNPAQEKFKTMIGGQALIEGIMMRGPYRQSIVVRTNDGLVKKVDEIKLIKDRYRFLGWPIVRGVINFGASMANGVKALMFSANYVLDETEEEPEEPGRLEQWLTDKFGQEKVESGAVGLSMFLGVALAVVLFILLPTFAASAFSKVIESHFVKNLLEGLIRIAIFVAYLAAVSHMKDMKRTFAYHGAEHKTIRCYEAGLPLTVENVRPMTRLHPRCGTSFLFVVMIVAILVYSVFSWSTLWVRIVIRLALLPVIVAITYEINRLVGKYDNGLTRVLTKPGMWLQYFTTQEPDDSMIEVAIAAIEEVIPEEEGADAW